MSNLRDSIHQRVRGKFFGNIVFVNFFIDIPEAKWVQTERQDVFNILWECKYLFEEKVSKYDTNLDIRPTYYYDIFDQYWPYVNRSLCKSEMEEWVERIFINAGFRSHDGAISYLQRELNREPIFLFHYKLEGCSYCLHKDWEYRVAMT